MPSVNEPNTSPGYWRSLAELADSPEFRAAAEITDKQVEELGEKAVAEGDGISRRRFLQLTGASVALASVAGCGKPDKVLPFAVQSASHVPGSARHLATTCEIGGFASGLLVTNYDGRPIKVEGNPDHPINKGGQDVFGLASTLDLYDPDRSRGASELVKGRRVEKTLADFLAYAGPLFTNLKGTKGEGLRILSEATGSPSLLALRDRLLKAYPSAKWVEYEPVSFDNVSAGGTMAFGKPMRTQLSLDKAEVVLSLDSDFLVAHPAAIKHARDFAAGRKAAGGKMSRLYAVENSYSPTGGVADHRLPLRAARVGPFAAALAKELSPKGEADKWKSLAGAGFAELPFFKSLVADLGAARGKSVVVVGERQPALVHYLGHLLNALLGNVGTTVHYTPETAPARPTHAEGIVGLAAEMAEGKVDTLLILGGNPVYNAPADTEFVTALAKVTNSIHLSLYLDETSLATRWHLPRAHYLESWGDATAWDGTVSIQQPMIAPLHGVNHKSAIELVSALLGGPADGADIVRGTFAAAQKHGTDIEAAWRKSLHDGVVAGTGFTAPAKPAAGPEVKPLPVGASFPAALLKADPAKPNTQDLELVFARDAKVYDGRFANNAWLQELPDSVTKLTWDNVALLAKSTADAAGVENGTLVKLRYMGREVECAAYILPGHAPGSVTVTLGYGRTAAGVIGGYTIAGAPEDKKAPSAGFDVYRIRHSAGMDIGQGLEIIATRRHYPLAATQDHHLIDALGAKGRTDKVKEQIREVTLETYLAKDKNGKHTYFADDAVPTPPLKSLWRDWDYNDKTVNPAQRKWGMAVDLAACTGCNACVIACQAENNIPVVGKTDVIRHREMHWIRIDRYFTGSVDDPRTVAQPVTCQHCEMAPCEQVCPVAATVHNNEGLNLMVYNRCIGTRYCANNCPYKVRRFNWFYMHFRAEKPENEVHKLVFNPEVTVRSRGVMEKCSFCQHRIAEANIKARNGDYLKAGKYGIPDGELQTACQQACPSGAITFGDLADRESRVTKLVGDEGDRRKYAMLAEFLTKPRLRYLARLRNPNATIEAPASKETHEHH